MDDLPKNHPEQVEFEDNDIDIDERNQRFGNALKQLSAREEVLSDEVIAERIRNVEVTDGARSTIKTLQSHGYEAFMVGGFVRDAVLGAKPKDEDITTNATPDVVMDLFSANGQTVIPSGIEFGTVTVMDSSSEDGYEVTTYRSDAASSDQRHPDSVSFVSSLREDMARRDFTMNALALDVSGDTPMLVDYFGGVDDIKHGIIRAVGDPEQRILEDALRMLRAVRFSAQKSMEIDSGLAEAISKHSSEIERCSGERIGAEVSKILLSDSPAKGIRYLRDLGLLATVAPAADRMYDTPQNNPWHLYNVGVHSEVAIENTPKNLDLRLAAWLHDTGKPETKTTDERGVDHFYGHPAQSAELAKDILTRLRFRSETVKNVCQLIALHDTPVEPTENWVIRFIEQHRDITPAQFDQLIALKRADSSAQNPELAFSVIEDLDDAQAIYHEIIGTRPYRIQDLALNGSDIMAIDTTRRGDKVSLRGPAIGIALDRMLSYCLRNPEHNNREDLTDFVRANLKNFRQLAEDKKKQKRS